MTGKKIFQFGIHTMVLCTVLLVAFCSCAFASESGKCGDNLSWTLNDNGVLRITGSGRMDDYNNDNMPWYNYKDQITSVVFENGITYIGEDAFSWHQAITNITIPDSVTSIGDYAFNTCSAIIEIIIPDSVKTIGHGVFYQCHSLENVKLPVHLDTISDYLFADCGMLSEIEIPETVTSIGELAFYRAGLFNVTISAKVTSIADAAFADCYYLQNIFVSNSNPQYTSVDGVLFSKDKTRLIQYPAGKEGYSYKIPDGVTYVEDMASCNLYEVIIPDSVEIIDDGAFAFCYNLSSLSIPRSVTEIGQYVINFSGVENIYVDEDNMAYSSADGVLFNKQQSELIRYPEKRTAESYIIPDSVTSINDRAFFDCDFLRSISIPEGVTSIGYDAFYLCDYDLILDIHLSITAIEYAKANGISYQVTTKNMLSLPKGLTVINDEAFMGAAFSGVIVPDGCTSIGSKAFANCTKLIYVSIPSSVTSIANDAFTGCDNAYLDYNR